jgi:hypothetical protein
MQPKFSSNEDLFWADIPEGGIWGIKWTGIGGSKFQEKYFGFILIYMVILTALIPCVLFSLVSHWFTWFYFFFVLVGMISSIIRLNRSRLKIENYKLLQAKAWQITGASTIGSADHLAGHPLLIRNQPVVLALKDDVLSIYSYASPIPIDTLSMAQITEINTIVYDDDRVPHLDVIDGAAQAIQLSFTRDGEIWKCVFQHMRIVRPIDWFHAFQQARMTGLSHHNTVA